VQLGPPAAQLGSCLEAGLARHADVEDREVDVALEPALDRLGAVDGLGDDLEIGLGVEDELQPLPDDRVIVGDENAGDEGDGN
jgi:hypothetical protein